MQGKKPTAPTKANNLKYTQMMLWLVKQGFSTADLKDMTLANAMYMMQAAFPEEKGSSRGDVRDATPADFHLLL